MAKLKLFKISVILYVLIHIFLMTVYYELTKEKNPYPFFVWHIFRPDPTRYVYHDVLLIRKINDRALEPPVDIMNLIETEFPHIRPYDFAGKVSSFSDALQNQKHGFIEKYKSDIESDLIKQHSSLDYELVRYEVNPILYVTKKEFISEQSLGVFKKSKQ